MRIDSRVVETGAVRRPRRNENGSALIFSLVLLIALTALVSGFLTLVSRTITSEHEAEWKQIARHLAEAGAEKAVAELRLRPAQYRGERDVAVGEGTFTVEAVPGEQPRTYTIAAVGKVLRGQRVIAEARVTVDLSLADGGRHVVRR